MKMIAILLAIYMFLGALYPRNDFSQMLRLPALMDHYACHVEEAEILGESISFSGFLLEHFYAPKSHQHPEDGEAHQNLPLTSIHSFLTFFASTPSLDLPLVESLPEVSFCSLENRPSSGFTASVFQPPIYS